MRRSRRCMVSRVKCPFCARRRRERVEVVDRWKRVIRHLLRIRRLQRYFGYIGQHLSAAYPDRLRQALRVAYPTWWSRARDGSHQ